MTNKRKNEAWQKISDQINALGVAKRSPNNLKEKWRAVKGLARKALVKEKSSLTKTGGGKPPPPLSALSQRIIEVLGDEPSFSGIQNGIESGESQSLNI